MPTTPNYAFPYPNLSDAPNGPAALEDLASATDTALAAVELASIPKTLVNAKGDLIAATGSDAVARLPVGTNGQVLAADSGESTGAKWVAPPVGMAAASSAAVATSQTTSSTSYTDLATVGPAVTVAVGASGVAIVTITSQILPPSGTATASFALSSGNTLAAADDNAISYTCDASGNGGIQASTVTVLTGLTPGSTVFTMKYKGTSVSNAFSNRKIGVVTF